jgi:arginine/lysine/ornithine decarboxylase
MLYLKGHGIHVEFYDDEVVVLMASPDNPSSDFYTLRSALGSLCHDKAAPMEHLNVPVAKRALSPREAMLSERETVKASDAVGRICASAAVSCPPAIPIAALGEVITEEAVRLFIKYHIDEIEVVKNGKL